MAFGAVLFSATGGYTAIWIYGLAGYVAAALLILAAHHPTLLKQHEIESDVPRS